MEMRFHWYSYLPCSNPVAIIGFPSIGLVSSIAASFLARELKLKLIAGFSSPDFPPYAVIQDGDPLPPIRIYAGPRAATDGVDCDGIVIITSELVPKPEQQHPLAIALLDWLRGSGIRQTITLEGIPRFGEQALLGAGSTEGARKTLEEYGVEIFKDGMIRGLSGVLLYESVDFGVEIATLLTTANTDLPDPRSATRLLEPLGRMFPEINVDTEPLIKEAEELEARISQMADSRVDEHIYG
jgi:uncharacterized protein